MTEFLQFLSRHDQALMVVLTAGILLSALVSLTVAIFLARENYLLRQAGTEPEVVAYLLPDSRSIAVLQFFLRNVGSGVALEVQFSIADNFSEFAEAGVQLDANPNRPAFNALPPGEAISSYFGLGHELLQEPRPGPVPIDVTYKNIRGQEYKKHFRLDPAQFEGLSRVGTEAIDDVAKSLKKIERYLGNLDRNSKMLKVAAASPDGWRREKERIEAELNSGED